jgi:signal transduction histidine kinase
LGVLIHFGQSNRGTSSDVVTTRDSLATQIWSQASKSFQSLASKSPSLTHTLSEKVNIISYGALALFGVLIAGLAIRNARKVARVESEARKENLLKNLLQEKDKAENLAELKSRFLSQASHDLRSPLAVILGYLDCMIDGLYGEIDVKHKKILEVLSRQSNDLKQMIDRILVFSRLEMGTSHVQIEDFPISKSVNGLKDTYDFLATQKGLEMRWVLSEDLPNLTSDLQMLKEILSNLLQNAIKFTHQGSVCLTIRYAPATDSIALEVQDTGIGIPRNSLTTIFDPFVQANSNLSQNPKAGFGLGLSIVKKHVEQLKGAIKVESELGKGTTFTITLPRIYREE